MKLWCLWPPIHCDLKISFFLVYELDRMVGSEIRIEYDILHKEKLARTEAKGSVRSHILV